MKPIEVPGDGDGHAHLTGVVAVAVGGVVAADAMFPDCLCSMEPSDGSEGSVTMVSKRSCMFDTVACVRNACTDCTSDVPPNFG